MKLLFEKYGNTREIAEVNTIEEAYTEINKFCSDRNYTIHYMRRWQQGNTTVVDVGSYTEFFHIVKESE